MLPTAGSLVATVWASKRGTSFHDYAGKYEGNTTVDERQLVMDVLETGNILPA